MEDQKKLFFIDAETDGLHGPFISVAIIVTDAECNEIDRKYFGIKKDNLKILDKWTMEHVVPYLGDYEECLDENELLDAFWIEWTKYKDEARAVGDVVFPVEARLFQKCIDKNKLDRCFQGPFPLLDISNMLYANGVNPLIERSLYLKEHNIILDVNNSNFDVQHNALYDVRVMIEVYKYLKNK